MSLTEMVKTWHGAGCKRERKWWCAWCGEDIEGEGAKLASNKNARFCNKQCARDWNNDVSAAHRERKRLATLRECRECKQMKPRLRRSVHFCSIECRQEDQRRKWRERSRERYHTDAAYRAMVQKAARDWHYKQPTKTGRSRYGYSSSMEHHAETIRGR